MEAKELMIGDWVMCPQCVGKVTGLYLAYHPICVNNYEYDEDFIYPIPLTEEILKANGFETNDNVKGYQYPNDEVIFCLEEFGGILIFNCVYNDILIEYVHQLQHALRLCGLNALADNFKLE